MHFLISTQNGWSIGRDMARPINDVMATEIPGRQHRIREHEIIVFREIRGDRTVCGVVALGW